MAKTYNLFISHSWDHLDDLKNLRTLLETRGYFNVEFLEVTPDKKFNSNNVYYLHACVRPLIEKADIVIGIAGVYASHSEWMQWELDTAQENDIPILGVIPWGQERVSKAVQDRADQIVRWNTESIVEAIRNLVK